MAQRTTTTLVQALLAQDWDGSTSTQPHIDSASVVTDRVVACAIRKDRTLTSGEAELVERWLAAHFYKYAADKEMNNRSVQGAVVSGQFTGNTNFDGISGTRYGQSAIRIDPSGCLNAIDKRATAGMVWLGRVPSEQTPYYERD